MKKILVITATLGDRETLSKTIESVKEVGADRVKHVIVTPSNRIPVLKSKYSDMEYLAEPEGCKGIYAALNHGFRTYAHEYEYMTFINDDDYWLPDYLYLITTILSDSSVDFVYGKIRYNNEKTHKIYNQASSSQFYDFLPLFQSGIVLLTQQATIVKTKLYLQIGGFDESYKLVADSKFWIDLSLLRPKFKYINRLCAMYTIQEGQLSSNRLLQAKEHNTMNKQYRKVGGIYRKIQTIKYRFLNIGTYIRRILN